jgi:LysM repeat protein
MLCRITFREDSYKMIHRALALITAFGLLVGSASPALAAPQTDGIVHTVQPGENLTLIARRYGVGIQAIVATNSLTTTAIMAGQKLTIPASSAASNPDPSTRDTTTAVNYVVKSGDYLSKIARDYGVSITGIMTASKITSTVIFAGQMLVIPATRTSAGAPPAVAATAVPGAQPTASAANPGTYTVMPGEYLVMLAKRFGTTYGELVRLNKLTRTGLVPGQVLIVPGGTAASTAPTTAPTAAPTAVPVAGATAYKVKPGDNLSRIAAALGTTVSALQLANGLKSTVLFAGQMLAIPGRSTAAPVATSVPAATAVPTAAPAATAVPTAAPVSVAPSTSGTFEVGGQVAGFGANAVSAMQSAGMKWVKHQVVWYPGANANDQAGTITNAHSKGFLVLFSTKGNPEYTTTNYYPEYAAFVGRLAALGADAIEIWNEMNLDREWKVGTISPATYTGMLKQAYTAIKGANAKTLVISGAPSPTGYFGGCGGNGCDDNLYIAGMVAAGALNYMDCVGMHYNEGVLSPTLSSGDPRGSSSHYTRYYPAMVNTYSAAVGGARKLCFTELGYLSGEEWGSLPANFRWNGATNMSVAQHAQYLGEAVSLARQQGKVRMLIVWNVDFTVYTDDPQAAFAIIRPNGSCPACSTIAAALR